METTDLLLVESIHLLEVEGFGRVWYHSLEHVVPINHNPEQKHTVCIFTHYAFISFISHNL